jgi:ABC-type branched-subunit amino acid transport system ATPase component
MSEDAILQVRNLRKSFGGVKAVENFSFSVCRGEVLGIIGPNGSGKTTLINLITNFVKKDSGKVIYKGRDITNWGAHRIADAGLARTFQIMRPYSTLPAFKNLIPALFSPRAKRIASGKLGDRDAVAIDLLEDVGFERDAFVPYKLAGTLPLGYLKRLEFARCLAVRPELIICDEIFSGLSMAEIASMVPLLEKLKMSGITMVMIEHRLRELFRVADRVIAMNFGEKITEGSPKEVINDERVKQAYLGTEMTREPGGPSQGRERTTEERCPLEVKNLMVFYENALAVNNMSLRCNEGEIVGVFGSNSAGKSTLMSAISGIILDVKEKEQMRGGERITVLGEIKFNGENLINLKPSERAKKGIILCPERRRIFPESSTLENLKMGGHLATRAQAKKTLTFVFELFPELSKLKKKDGGFLSGGEQQMLAIGRALMAQPKLLLLDEPLLGLAPAVEARLARAIREIRDRIGFTILVSEQYARPIFPIIDYGYIIEKGGTVMEGVPEELMDNPDVVGAYFGM